MFRLSLNGIISLSAISIFTSPFLILYMRVSLARFLLSSRVCQSMASMSDVIVRYTIVSSANSHQSTTSSQIYQTTMVSYKQQKNRPGINTLDLIATNHFYSFQSEITPEVSYHDIVYTEIDFVPIRQQQKPRQIPLYSKADRKM